MAEKTLAEIAREAWWGGTGPTSAQDWQAVADAVEAAIEARRWQAWPPCVDGALPDVVALDDPKLGRRFGFLRDGKWWDEDGDEITPYVYPPKRWTPIPAPPKEVERG